MADTRVSAFVWGSCVSRDTVEHCPDIDVAVYIARQSAISLASDVTDAVPAHTFTSPFQQRMSVWDLAGNAGRQLGSYLDAGLILVDLCDERLGVYEVAPGAYATRTVERVAEGVDDQWAARYRHIPFGSEEHLGLWTAAMGQFLKRTRLWHVSHRLRVVGLPWASATDAGETVPASFGMTPDDANLLFRPYLDVFRQDGVRVVGEGISPVAATGHRWGPAPFHYTTETYQALCAELREA